MDKERAPDDERLTKDFEDNPDAFATSLTDLIDEMDRAAFRRSLASRHPIKKLEITGHNLEHQDAPPKT